MRKLFLAALLAAACPFAQAANVPLATGPFEASQGQAILNNTIQQFNAGTTGLLGSTLNTPVTVGTSITTLATYTLNGGVMATAGQLAHVHAWGTNSADANAKTLTFSFGGSVIAPVITGSGFVWVADFYVMKTGVNTQVMEGHVLAGNIVVPPITQTSAIVDTAAITILIQGTAAVAGTITLNGAYIEQVK